MNWGMAAKAARQLVAPQINWAMAAGLALHANWQPATGAGCSWGNEKVSGQLVAPQITGAAPCLGLWLQDEPTESQPKIQLTILQQKIQLTINRRFN